MWTAALLAGLFLAVCSFAEAAEKKVDSLQVRWGPQEDRVAKTAFFQMPRTRQEAIAANPPFVPVSANAECGGEGKFAGLRYYRKGDLSVILIFDKSGDVAGLQTAFPKSKVESNGGFAKKWFDRQRKTGFLQDDNIGGVDAYTVTAYFSDPSKICSKGQKKQCGVKYLSFQTGSKPQENIQIPISETQTKSKSWVSGVCFPQMGTHYYYDISLGMDCREFRPVFIMYNEGKLGAFGLFGFSHFDNANYEYMPKDLLPSFFGANKTPTCVNDLFDQIGGYTSMHVFFYDPQNTTCSAA